MCSNRDNFFHIFSCFVALRCPCLGHLRRPCHSERSKTAKRLRSRTFLPRSQTMLRTVWSSLRSDFDFAQDDTAKKHRAMRRWNLGRIYDTRATGICTEVSIFSIKMPYPVVGSLISTWVTAPTSLSFWMMGEPDTSVVKKGQQNLTKRLNQFIVFLFFFLNCNGVMPICFLNNRIK